MRRGVLARRGIDRSLLEDQAPFEPMETTAWLNDANSVLLKAEDVENYLKEAYRDMGVPDQIAQKWLRYVHASLR